MDEEKISIEDLQRKQQQVFNFYILIAIIIVITGIVALTKRVIDGNEFLIGGFCIGMSIVGLLVVNLLDIPVFYRK